MPFPPTFDARLVAARSIAPTVRELAFERLDGAPMTFEPGQWVNAYVPVASDGAPQTKRSYSIASPPDGTARFELAITRVQGGAASNWLHGAPEGTTLSFTGPQGFFTRSMVAPAPSLFIATGTGVTPLRSMLRASLAAGSHAPTWVLLGVRRAEDVLYDGEFRALAAAHSFVRFEPTLSQPPGDWSGRRGYVQTHVRALWAELSAWAGEEPHAYVCGLQRMVGSVRDLLRKEMGVGREHVHSELYD
jgi:ferredoxin-NADP reductase